MLKHLYEKQNGRCHYCDFPTIHPLDIKRGTNGTPYDFDYMKYKVNIDKKYRRKYARYMQPTIEHLHRIADGGLDHKDNRVMACGFCNTMRHDRTVEEHKMFIAHLIDQKLHPFCVDFCWVKKSNGLTI